MFWALVHNGAPAGRELTIDGTKGHHLGRVLRVRPGERGVAVIEDRRYDVEVVRVDRDRVLTRVLESSPVEDPSERVTILQSVLPNADFDSVVEGVTALGIRRLIAVQAARSVRHPGPDRLPRWQAIAESAAEQSHAFRVPQIDGPVPLETALANLEVPLLSLDPGASRLLSEVAEPGTPYALAVGPEGGWTADELDRLAHAGGIPVSLGHRILRARLAPIVATAILVHQS